jgi:hypothetical protein
MPPKPAPTSKTASVPPPPPAAALTPPPPIGPRVAAEAAEAAEPSISGGDGEVTVRYITVRLPVFTGPITASEYRSAHIETRIDRPEDRDAVDRLRRAYEYMANVGIEPGATIKPRVVGTPEAMRAVLRAITQAIAAEVKG